MGDPRNGERGACYPRALAVSKLRLYAALRAVRLYPLCIFVHGARRPGRDHKS